MADLENEPLKTYDQWVTNEPAVQMKQLKFGTTGKLPIILVETVEYTLI